MEAGEILAMKVRTKETIVGEAEAAAEVEALEVEEVVGEVN